MTSVAVLKPSSNYPVIGTSGKPCFNGMKIEALRSELKLQCDFSREASGEARTDVQ
jgi:hypothetical protein